MTHKSYTLIVVPQAQDRLRRYQVSVRLAKWTAVAGVIVSLALIGGIVHYVQIWDELGRLREVAKDNMRLTLKTREYERGTTQLEAKVVKLQKTVAKLGVMAGLEQLPPDAALGGVGGVSSPDSMSPGQDLGALVAMQAQVELLNDRSAQLENFYRDRALLLNSTPSVWPVRGYLSAGFGNRKDPFTGQKDFHPGIDISTPLGTRIQAPANGLVLSCRQRGGYGNAVVIDHGYGIVTRYAHLDRFNVKPGQRVKRGDVIGFVGNTGRSTAPHLHYEVWVNDRTRNPIHYILDEYRTFG